MGIRKNAKYLTASEIDDFVQACVLMKADIVNPADPVPDQYGRWDEFVALHNMIQNAFSPSAASVNFGHGGSGAFSFFSWHRYFLLQFEKELQTHVPSVMLPYWDWTDPTSLFTDAFLGSSITGIVSSGYFAEDAPSTGSNPTPSPAWWPVVLEGWNLDSNAFPLWGGPLRRNVGGSLPTLSDIQEALNMTTYASLQDAIESGTGLSSFHQMHNGLHGYIGGHMGNATASPFDPIFYMHHCNIDRLWAMWQMDGHATTYPTIGGNPEHHRTDIMYPWTGGAAGYGTNQNLSPITMPDFSALGVQRNENTLDHRALGYTYDSLAIIGVSLDRTGSMSQFTPDPMTVAAPNITKWEAATRGVGSFLQDCEAAYLNKEAYVYAGVETFRSSGGNQFSPIFGVTPSGLIKTGGAHSKATFDAAIAAITPSGGTPLADALTHADNELVKTPFSDLPTDERRYLAILTDGRRTSGSTIASIPAGSLRETVVFAMGFGTGADVDYTALDQLITKGTILPSIQQVFHGENAGTIDKFYTNSLAESIGYTPIVDPLLELFAGEHTHIDFYATSAEDSFFITAQGMDYSDRHWSFHLEAPDGTIIHLNKNISSSHSAGNLMPSCSLVRSNGRLSLFLKRDNADYHLWIGKWRLMAAYKATDMSIMMMLPKDVLLAPVSAGPLRGPRFYRPRSIEGKRIAARAISGFGVHTLDNLPAFTSADSNDACNLTVNIYARTRLRLNLSGTLKSKLIFKFTPDLRGGKILDIKAIGRIFSPNIDIPKLFDNGFERRITRGASLRRSRGLKFDSSKIMAKLEKDNKNLFRLEDKILDFKITQNGIGKVSLDKPNISGVHHVGVLIEGLYQPDDLGTKQEYFERILTYTYAK